MTDLHKNDCTRMEVRTDLLEGHVVLTFSAPVGAIVMSREQALDIAESLAKAAVYIRRQGTLPH